jgi:hypothetical protein
MAKDDTVVILDQASGYLQIDMLNALSKKYKKCVIIAGTSRINNFFDYYFKN